MAALGSLRSGQMARPITTSVVAPLPQKPARRRATPQRVGALPSSATTTRDLPHKVVQTFYVVQDPALFNQNYSSALLSFVDAAILAYECGMNEDCLQKELLAYMRLLESQQAPAGMRLNVEACMLGTALVWVTLLKSPRTLKRWATLNPVTDDTLALWGGFVQMIVDGYFNRRMAWYPLDKLDLELGAVHGRNYQPQDIAEWARIVFTVLEKVHPQFPSE